jgi:hypothetical protein
MSALPIPPSAKFQGDCDLINFAPSMQTTEYILGTFANNGGNIPNELPLFLGDPDVRRPALQECPEPLHDYLQITRPKTVGPVCNVQFLHAAIQHSQTPFIAKDCRSYCHAHGYRPLKRQSLLPARSAQSSIFGTFCHESTSVVKKPKARSAHHANPV